MSKQSSPRGSESIANTAVVTLVIAVVIVIVLAQVYNHFKPTSPVWPELGRERKAGK